KLGGGGEARPEFTEDSIPQSRMTGTCKELFDFVAGKLAEFIATEGEDMRIPPGTQRQLGFTFSFPVEQTSIHRGTLETWTKGFNIEDALNKEMVDELTKGMKEAGITDMRVAALVNDTVGTLAGGKYSDPDVIAAVILGTGTNAAYIERVDAIPKWEGTPPKSGEMMLRISFRGLAGTFQLINGRMSTQVLEIINVIGNRERRVGFWTKGVGLTRQINKLNSIPDIIWPGEVFLAAFNGLGHDVPLEYIPFTGKAEQVNYNDLIDRVHNGEFHAAIGDITITANRSKYVDFTLPYTDIGLATLSRNANGSIWIFMKPFSSDLWVVSACFFIITGIVVWILEHRTNEEFQGSTAEQIGKTFWFAFSTLVYAHREKLQSNLSRFVVIVWLFVVLVLVSSYTATLSSLLTVEQIQLASKSRSIGYQLGSPVQGAFVRNFKFEGTTLKPNASLPEKYADALTRGTKNGGVDAIVDEIPYIKEFLAEYPSGYSMTVSETIPNGFGFVSLFTILFFDIRVNMGKRTSDISAMHHDTHDDLKEVATILKEKLEISDISKETSKLIVGLCEIVATRAARLSAAGILGILKKLGRDNGNQKSVIAVDGGLFEHYGKFRNAMQKAMEELLGEEASKNIIIKQSNDGSGLGAALLAASNPCVAE
nr:extracellular ligand-binding receptor [Tanacetum cinerariifolium]